MYDRKKAQQLGLTIYMITRKRNGAQYKIVARNIGMAWRKFVEQRFGALKPCREDYRIRTEAREITGKRGNGA